MTKTDFFSNIKDVLELSGNVDENTAITLSSMEILSLITFIDENFDKRVKANEFKNVNTVNDIITMIGRENIV